MKIDDMVLVYLNDAGLDYTVAEQLFGDADAWAREFCDSYILLEVIDISDFSGHADTVAEYSFRDDSDAMIFRLRWA